MDFRIAVNLGDVIVEGEQIYGDWVNVAARLESLAEAGGICIAAHHWNDTKRLALLRANCSSGYIIAQLETPPDKGQRSGNLTDETWSNLTAN